ncbi:MAG TPA: hypothetical protein VGQ11_11670 [Candidatus Acidoferrales bacterium]|nr:hypothetical protein [Candidatus Acidoferrales bacterium]
MRECEYRPSPPDVPGDVDERVGAAEDFSGCRAYAQFRQQLFAGKTEQKAYPRLLQCCAMEPATEEHRLEPAGQRRTERAIAVVKDPAAARAVMSLSIR